MSPETEPAERPPISELTDQNALCERYKAPAPPASTMLASRASATWVPSATKIAARIIAPQAERQRPTRLPYRCVMRSLTHPPSEQQSAMAANGSMEYPALAFKFNPRTLLK